MGETIAELRNQTRRPQYLILSIHDGCDLPDLTEIALPDGCELHIVSTELGTSRQRNSGLDRLAERVDFLDTPGIILFLDDDFIMRMDWLETLLEQFQGWPDVVGFTGILLADGAPGAGITTQEALRMLENGSPVLPRDDWRIQAGATDSLYGCNMAIRSGAMVELRFDENLPLYGWLEDFDFSVRLRSLGSLSRSASLVGVHLGVKSGRSSGLRVGYSQVANPFYLCRKGTMSGRTALKYGLKNMIANLVRCVSGDAYIDRRGRLKGNLLAIRDIIGLRSNPSRILPLS